MTWHKLGPFLLSATFVCGGAFASGDSATLERLLDLGKNHNRAPELHRELCEKIGPRLTGSKELNRGLIWAISKFQSFGVDRVMLDRWGVVPRSFSRGPAQSVRLLGAGGRNMVFTTPAWTVGTPGPVRGRVLSEPESADKVDSKFAGAWVLMKKEVGMGMPTLREPGPVDRALDGAGIAGRIYHTNGDLVWTGGSWNAYNETNQPRTPIVIVRKQDFEAAQTASAKGSATIEANIDNRIGAHPLIQYNVIADIIGTEKPGEMVIVSGHFDSWNGPGSQGANDNGTGSASTLEAARLLMASGAKPKRTIRFILWTGEEQGLLGSSHYVREYASRLDKISGMFVEDSGQNWHASIAATENMVPVLERVVEPMKTAFPNMPMSVRTVTNMRAGGGSDHAPFLRLGVPAFFLGKGGDKPYRFVWHTQNDRWTETPPENLRQMSTNLAVLAYNLACEDEMLPRVPKPSAG